MAIDDCESAAKGDSSPEKRLSGWKAFWHFYDSFGKTIMIFVIIICMLPLPIIGQNKIAGAGYTVIVMASLWVLELVPLSVTALLPLIFFPMLGVEKSSVVSPNYFKDTNSLFLGGLIMAVAIEHRNLHKRIALYVLVLLGAKPHFLYLGFMGVCAFLSMWISNSATAAMMLPIAQAVILELSKNVDDGDSSNNVDKNNETASKPEDIRLTALPIREKKLFRRNSNSLTVAVTPPGEEQEEEEGLGAITFGREDKPKLNKERFDRIVKGLVLSVAYSANIGGTATLTGTPPNLILSGIAAEKFPNAPPIDFARWFLYGFPAMLLLLFFAWIWLVFYFTYDDYSCKGLVRFLTCNRLYKREVEDKSWDAESAKAVIRQEYNKLGKMSYPEWVISVLAICLALLWLTRSPGFIPGWANLFLPRYVSDATAAIIIAFLLFAIPCEPPWSYNYYNPKGKVERLLDFGITQRKLSWNVILLMGGSFALASGCESSGLSAWLGEELRSLGAFPPFVVQLLITVIILLLTEVMSNTATTTIFVPLIAELAISMGIHPYYFVLPATLAASYAFMLPAATPPNAIAFSSGYLRGIDMVKAGAMMNVLGVFVILLITNTLGIVEMNLLQFPEWALLNTTTTVGPSPSLICIPVANATASTFS